MIPYLSQIKMGLMAGAALALVIGTAWATHRFDSAELNRFKAAQYEQAAKDNAIAMAQMQAHDAAVNAAVSALADATAQREAQSQQLRKAISSAPKTRACVDSPAIHSLLDGLRAGSANSH